VNASRPRLTAVQKNALRIVAMMDRDGKPTYMPTRLADQLIRRGFLLSVEDGWHSGSKGLERTVRFTQVGREIAGVS